VTVKAISESSPVTMGAAAGIIVVAFWSGGQIERMKTHIEFVRQTQTEFGGAIAALNHITTDHEARLKSAERAAQLAGH
jgi:hypothetical protein